MVQCKFNDVTAHITDITARKHLLDDNLAIINDIL